MGCDWIEISAHGSHPQWQGKIVSLSGRKGYLSKRDIGYGTGPGFKGWNCRHDWYPFFCGDIQKSIFQSAVKGTFRTKGSLQRRRNRLL
ncbi:phage minor capsid protein [Yeguia hominis]|uniref:Uncharacterized protein n=1 Tax=Yeguia hominis TaxID=2763662 RepID=A0A926HT82_9FIRM|nr:hypothetical protein [Yeguia hominis]